jgi:hypothetical protein
MGALAMSKAATIGASLVFFFLMISGLWDLFSGANALVASIALIFVAVGIFNTCHALKEDRR